MGKVYKSNLFFALVLLWMVIGVYPLVFLVRITKITDLGLLLLIQHVFLIIIPGIIYLIKSKESVKSTLRLNKLNFKQITLVIGIALLSQPIMTFFSLISSFFFKNDVSDAIFSMSDKPYLLLLSLIALLPSISEELIIRGIVLKGYENKNKYIAALVTGIMFGMFHLNYHQFLYTAVMGFILSLVVITTNSIYSSMIIHFIINGISVTMMKITSSLPDIEVSQASTITLQDNIIIVIFMFIIAFVCFLIVKKLFGKLKMASSFREEVKEEDDKERVMNLPFIFSIFAFIIYMFILN